jgi:hypothetical protein
MKWQAKVVVFLGVGVVLVGIIILLTNNTNPPATTSSQPATPAANSSIQTVQLANISTIAGQLDSKTIDSIESELYQRIMQNSNPAQVTYEGTIRAGSFTAKSSEYSNGSNYQQVPTYTFLVDIPDVQQTYSVSFSGGDGYPYSILYVLCPTPDQLIYPAFTCSDES